MQPKCPVMPSTLPSRLPCMSVFRSVVVNAKLKEIEPMAYGFLLNFALDNEMQVRHGRDKPRDPPAEAGP